LFICPSPTLNFFRNSQALEFVFQDKGIQDIFDFTFILITKFIDFFEISQQKSTTYLGIGKSSKNWQGKSSHS